MERVIGLVILIGREFVVGVVLVWLVGMVRDFIEVFKVDLSMEDKEGVCVVVEY